jgi:Trk K+ transport system NAD-binding subunit
VVIYRYGAGVESLVEELANAKVPSLLVETDETRARNLVGRRIKMVYGPTAQEAVANARLDEARCRVTNGSDEENVSVILLARQLEFAGEILAMVDEPELRQPMALAGANAVYTPRHLLATVLAARASHRIQPRITGFHPLGPHLEVSEIRVEVQSPLAGKTLQEVDLGARTGTTVLGQWVAGRLESQVAASTRIEPRGILVAIGRPENLDRLAELAGGPQSSKRQGLKRRGHFIVGGCGLVGRKIRQLLRDVGEEVVAVDLEDASADLVGNVLDPKVLEAARIDDAQAIILALNTDSATLFAAVVVRNRAPELPIIARVNEASNVERIHGAGADFALSFSQVSGQILARRLLGQESVSVDPQLKVLKTAAGKLAGKRVGELDVRARTGCSVVAVERADEVVVHLGRDFLFAADGLRLRQPEGDVSLRAGALLSGETGSSEPIWPRAWPRRSSGRRFTPTSWPAS